jgi:GrpB-like predicted nucleotidyltransferase (UPF0157 family)
VLTFRSSLKLGGQLLDRVALAIDHTASTSVPGLRAKDVIDVQFVVAKLDTERIVPALAGFGFEQKDHAVKPPGSRPGRWVRSA